MKNPHIYFIIYIIMILFLQCEEDFESITAIQNEVLLEYNFMQGWSGRISSLIFFRDNSAEKIVDNHKIFVEFSENELTNLNILLADYLTFKRVYRLKNNPIYDIDTHELIYFRSAQPDTVSILKPLNSSDIPKDLIELIDLLKSKL